MCTATTARSWRRCAPARSRSERLRARRTGGYSHRMILRTSARSPCWSWRPWRRLGRSAHRGVRPARRGGPDGSDGRVPARGAPSRSASARTAGPGPRGGARPVGPSRAHRDRLQPSITRAPALGARSGARPRPRARARGARARDRRGSRRPLLQSAGESPVQPGTFVTGAVYRGKHGLAIRLRGLDPGLNDRAEARAIGLVGEGTIVFAYHPQRPAYSAVRRQLAGVGRS